MATRPGDIRICLISIWVCYGGIRNSRDFSVVVSTGLCVSKFIFEQPLREKFLAAAAPKHCRAAAARVVSTRLLRISPYPPLCELTKWRNLKKRRSQNQESLEFSRIFNLPITSSPFHHTSVIRWLAFLSSTTELSG